MPERLACHLTHFFPYNLAFNGGRRILSDHNSHRGCPTLPALFAGGWVFIKVGSTPRRSRFRAVHCDSIPTLPSFPVA